MCCPTVTSEDCLTLNVFTPLAETITKPLPVMVFIPGGRFEQGASGTILYDGTYITNTSSTVLVTMNYRLGILGYMYAEKFGGTSVARRRPSLSVAEVRTAVVVAGSHSLTRSLCACACVGGWGGCKQATLV